MQALTFLLIHNTHAREMTALVLVSGCKHILPVLGACPLFQVCQPTYCSSQTRAHGHNKVLWPLHPNTLEHALWSTSEPSLINALGLLKDVAKAICCLHALGFLHKNVNPGTSASERSGTRVANRAPLSKVPL